MTEASEAKAALVAVSDLMRRVGVLETKVAGFSATELQVVDIECRLHAVELWQSTKVSHIEVGSVDAATDVPEPGEFPYAKSLVGTHCQHGTTLGEVLRGECSNCEYEKEHGSADAATREGAGSGRRTADRGCSAEPSNPRQTLPERPQHIEDNWRPSMFSGEGPYRGVYQGTALDSWAEDLTHRYHLLRDYALALESDRAWLEERCKALEALVYQTCQGYSWADAVDAAHDSISSAPPEVRAALSDPTPADHPGWTPEQLAKWLCETMPERLIEAGWVPRDVAAESIDEFNHGTPKPTGLSVAIDRSLARWLASREKEKADAK